MLLVRLQHTVRSHALAIRDPSVTGRWRLLPHGSACIPYGFLAIRVVHNEVLAKVRVSETDRVYRAKERAVRRIVWLAQPEYWISLDSIRGCRKLGTRRNAVELAQQLCVQARMVLRAPRRSWRARLAAWLAYCGELNARILLHGTSSSNARALLAGGFSLAHVGSRGGAFMDAPGAYLTAEYDTAVRFSDTRKTVVVVLAAGRSFEDSDPRYTAFCYSGCCPDSVCYHDVQLLLPLFAVVA